MMGSLPPVSGWQHIEGEPIEAEAIEINGIGRLSL